MAINIESGSTWAEIRRLLNKDSAEQWKREGDAMTGSLILAKDPEGDMEAANKNYIDDRLAFMPGELNSINLGSTSLLGGIPSYSSIDGILKLEKIYEETFIANSVPLASGMIKAKFVLKAPDLYSFTKASTNPIETLYDTVTPYFSIKLTLSSGDKEYVIAEENNVSYKNARADKNSVFYMGDDKPPIIIDNVLIQHGQPIQITSEFCMNSISGLPASHRGVIWQYSGRLDIKGGIGNNVLGLSSSQIGVWSNE